MIKCSTNTNTNHRDGIIGQYKPSKNFVNTKTFWSKNLIEQVFSDISKEEIIQEEIQTLRELIVEFAEIFSTEKFLLKQISVTRHQSNADNSGRH